MDSNIFVLLLRDGVTTGLIYALLGIAGLLVFAVTRVLFVPQGEFVAFSALGIVALQDGRVPGTAGLLVMIGLICALVRTIRERRGRSWHAFFAMLGLEIALPLGLLALTRLLAPMHPGYWITIPLTVGNSILLGAVLYRLVFQPIADASVLVLLIAAVGVHIALAGLGLYFFGAEGFRSLAFSESTWSFGVLSVTFEDVAIVIATIVLMAALRAYFGRTLSGKALRASAINRVGARLVGISTVRSGQIAFGLAAAIGALSGVLTGPITTVYYDTGFLIGLKGILATVLGGLSSYPLTVVASVGLGLIESFASFWASSYKEVIVFLVVVPVLLWRSIVSPHIDEDA